MPGRYWLPIIVVVGLALLGVLTWWLVERQNEREAAYQAAYQQYEDTKRDLPLGAANDGRRSVPDPKSYRDEWRSERDLEAQREMANWAYFMLVASGMSVFVTAVGVVYVALTLRATRDAVEEAKSATRVAEDSVTVTRETAERQLRAYVHPTNATLEMKEDGLINASLTFINAGQTPAYKFECRYSLTFSSNLHSPGGADIEHVKDGKSFAILQPNGAVEGSITGRGELIPEFLRMLADRRLAMFVHGRLTYRDVFKNDQITKFQYVYIGPWGGEKPLTICEEGNDAT